MDLSPKSQYIPLEEQYATPFDKYQAAFPKATFPEFLEAMRWAQENGYEFPPSNWQEIRRLKEHIAEQARLGNLLPYYGLE